MNLYCVIFYRCLYRNKVIYKKHANELFAQMSLTSLACLLHLELLYIDLYSLIMCNNQYSTFRFSSASATFSIIAHSILFL